MRWARLLIYEPLKNTLGFSRIRVAYTAGEAIGAELFAFYRSLGLNLKQLYGQTEAFLYVTVQADGAVRSDTVGPPAPNVDLRRRRDGEVQFKSPGMFVGYYDEPEKTRGGADATTAMSRPATPASSSRTASSRSSTAPRMSAGSRAVSCSRRNISRTS